MNFKSVTFKVNIGLKTQIDDGFTKSFNIFINFNLMPFKKSIRRISSYNIF